MTASCLFPCAVALFPIHLNMNVSSSSSEDKFRPAPNFRLLSLLSFIRRLCVLLTIALTFCREFFVSRDIRHFKSSTRSVKNTILSCSSSSCIFVHLSLFREYFCSKDLIFSCVCLTWESDAALPCLQQLFLHSDVL